MFFHGFVLYDVMQIEVGITLRKIIGPVLIIFQNKILFVIYTENVGQLIFIFRRKLLIFWKKAITGEYISVEKMKNRIFSFRLKTICKRVVQFVGKNILYHFLAFLFL